MSNNDELYGLAFEIVSRLNRLRRFLAPEGYSIVVEDKSLIDETPVFTVYKGGVQQKRFPTLDALQKWAEL